MQGKKINIVPDRTERRTNRVSPSSSSLDNGQSAPGIDNSGQHDLIERSVVGQF